MPCPRAIHAANGLVLLVLLENLKCPTIEFGVSSARIQRGHPANCQHAALVANLRHQLPQILEERDIVWNGIAVRQHPIGIGQIEINQTRHVVPTPEVQSQDVVTQVVEKFLHLERERVRFHQRHALDVILGPATRLSQGLKQIAPP